MCDVMAGSDKKVCLAGGLDPRDSTFIIKLSCIFIDQRFQCIQVHVDTRIIF